MKTILQISALVALFTALIFGSLGIYEQSQLLGEIAHMWGIGAFILLFISTEVKNER